MIQPKCALQECCNQLPEERDYRAIYCSETCREIGYKRKQKILVKAKTACKGHDYFDAHEYNKQFCL